MHSDSAALAWSKRDFWLCLARAFAPPGGADYLTAFTADLPGDLEAIAEEIGLVLSAEVRDFAAAARQLNGPIELQKLYASLFLTPPTPVMANTCVYIDGGLMGQSEQGLQEAYARHGFERHKHFRDLNDTVGVQSDFLALLYDKAGIRAKAGDDIEARAYLTEAESFVAAYPCRWISPFLHDLENVCREHALNPVYVHLARMLWLAVRAPCRPRRYMSFMMVRRFCPRGRLAASAL
ncbi:MAG: molecular chaperone TorD family protein [Gammaproteobacteria bacterium]|nr:molecular chaperone TorD family protein [Gammaproteobacteria bacterium]